MPRKLPWMQKGGGSTTVTRPKKAAISAAKPFKRPRAEESECDDSTGETAGISGKEKSGSQVHSSSPPPEPPSERYMDEGMEHDDKYRMVEDEFLTVAQKWTVHLHAAEYKRQEKMVKARNAETISSISRPVTDRMPDHTRRRVESVARSKTQRNAVEGLLEKKAAADDTDDSDEGGLPYTGTTLHGLMDSPRRKAASLSKVGSARTATRAAAGFQKPAQSKMNSSQIMASDSPILKSNQLPSHALIPESEISTASSDDDDDLDAPIPVPKLESISRVSKPPPPLSSRPIASSSVAPQSSRSTQRSTFVRPQVTVATVESAVSRPGFTDVEPPGALCDISRRRAKRQELARLEEAKQEKEEQKKKKKCDVIPTFL